MEITAKIRLRKINIARNQAKKEIENFLKKEVCDVDINEFFVSDGDFYTFVKQQEELRKSHEE